MQLKQLQLAIDKELFTFFRNQKELKSRPVVNLKLDKNIISILFEVLEKEDKELYNLLNNGKFYTQLEAASRIFYIDTKGELVSVLYNDNVFKGIMDDKVMTAILAKIKEETIDYIPHNSAGVSISTEGLFPLIFMKHESPIIHSRSEVINHRKYLKESIINTIPYEILIFIKNNKLDALDRKKREAFESRIKAIETFLSFEEHDNLLYSHVWNNPNVLDFITVGLYSGMKKLYDVSNGFKHVAMNSFIELYNKS